MLRPATPLSGLLLVAFGLLLVSVISAPIIAAIPLCDFDGVKFGVFGYCRSSGCSGFSIGYNFDGVVDAKDFDLPQGVRNTLTAILIVHPVAALLTLIMLGMAVAAHFHSASHSARYLLIVFIFSLITFLVCLLAFLIDVLLFIPHLGWGTYLVLAATIMVGLGGLVSCAMRRTLVSRKARKKEIAENAEMSGENYYNRENQIKANTSVSTAPQPTMPILSGGNGGADNLPQFASFNDTKDDQGSDEQIPLTSRSPMERTPSNINSDAGSSTNINGYGNAPPSRAGSVPRPERDQYGNPIATPQEAYGVRRAPSNETNRSYERMNPMGRGGMSPAGSRGRGAYGRGGYGPPPAGARGGFGPRGRGGYGLPPNGRGGYGPRGRGGPGYGSGAMMSPNRGPQEYRNDQGPYDRRGSPADTYGSSDPYTINNSTNPSLPSISQGSYEAYNPQRSSLPRAESPPPLPGMDDQPQAMGLPVGQAIEMDARSGSPAHPPQGFGSFNGIRDSDADIAGMVGLQEGRPTPPNRHDTMMTEGSRYSTDEQYIPPRQAWGQGPGSHSPRMQSPLSASPQNVARHSPAPISGSPNNYYEDVDPRFASTTPDEIQPPSLPANMPPPAEPYSDGRPQRGARARSPGAESDRSNFTSISQRSVNPRWNPPPPMPGYGGQPLPRRAPPQRQQDMILNNPDFELRGGRVGGGQQGRSGMIPGSSYPR